MANVSIVVPIYNAEKYLERCVNSLLEQTFRDLEIILVDDGSLDRSLQLCFRYAKQDERVHVISKENGGLSSARNAGIAAAKGDYLLFVDSDDVLLLDAIEKLFLALEQTGADIAIGKFCKFSNEKELEQYQKKQEKICCATLTSGELLRRLILNPTADYLISCCGKLYKRELFRELSFPEGKLFEDEFVNYKIYHRIKTAATLDKTIYFYFINANGITQNLTLQKRMDEYQAQWERIVYLRDNELTELYELAIMQFLHSAQWDLIECRKGEQLCDAKKKRQFYRWYRTAFYWAKADKLISFKKNYDYFVLALPFLCLAYRAKRLILKTMGKF